MSEPQGHQDKPKVPGGTNGDGRKLASAAPPTLDDMPLAERLRLLKEQKAAAAAAAPAPAAGSGDKRDERDRDDIPLAHRLAFLKRKQEEAEQKEAEGGTKREHAPKKTATTNTAKGDGGEPKAKMPKKSIADSRGEHKGEAAKKKLKASGVQGQAESKPKPKRASEEKSDADDQDDDGDAEFKWWKAGLSDTSIKWSTLEHNGPLFPPPYEPHSVPLLYEGRPLVLEPEAEEVAGFFGALLGTDHAENPVFQRNFFEDFLSVLKECNSRHYQTIKDFSKCDFTKMHRHFEMLREKKKAATKEEKEQAKELKTQQEQQYGFAILDGRREKIGSFRIEPPGLFRGRGKHPKTGKLKQRVKPEQVTINIGAGPLSKIPVAPGDRSWGRVVSDNTVTWLATWVENINGAQKYVFLAPGSSLKGQSDLKKFETARRLKQFVGEIRKQNAAELHSKEMFVRQRATALWLIDHLALRAGNEKGDDEADTVGCCSLRLEHVRLVEPSTVVFDFLGKDSIRYYNEVRVEPIVFKNLAIFMRPPKTPTDPIFDRLNTALLNKYLNGLMPGLTAKVFRTYNASYTFQAELEKTPDADASIAEKILAYNRANREVAILCNHQKAVSKTHGQSMERLREKVLTLKYQRHLVRKSLKETLSAKELRAQCQDAASAESDMDGETVKRKERETEEERIARYRKAHPDSSQSSPPPSPQKRASAESLVKKFEALTARIHAARHLLVDRDENKTTALGTSKTNYIDPRITAAWCAKHEVPVEKMFTKTLREKFTWAIDSADKGWQF